MVEVLRPEGGTFAEFIKRMRMTKKL